MEQLLERLESLEGELDGMYRELERTQRLSMLGEVMSVLAHEINNLLTPLRSYTQLALEHEDPALMRKALERARVAGDQAARITGAVLGIDQEGDESFTRVQPCLEEVFLCLGRDPARDGIALDVHVADITVQMTRSELHQVLMNLVLNARAAMRDQDRPRRLGIRASAAHGSGIIEVTDSGCGIPDDAIPNIFRSFYSGAAGSGLGLSVSKRLIERRGGSIDVTSTVGVGTSFVIQLPLAIDLDRRSAA